MDGARRYSVNFSSKAEKAYGKLSAGVRDRIDNKLRYLRESPRGPDSVKLSGATDAYRTRVGDYRIVYEIEDARLIVWIIDVGHRRDIYK